MDFRDTPAGSELDERVLVEVMGWQRPAQPPPSGSWRLVDSARFWQRFKTPEYPTVEVLETLDHTVFEERYCWRMKDGYYHPYNTPLPDFSQAAGSALELLLKCRLVVGPQDMGPFGLGWGVTDSWQPGMGTFWAEAPTLAHAVCLGALMQAERRAAFTARLEQAVERYLNSDRCMYLRQDLEAAGKSAAEIEAALRECAEEQAREFLGNAA